MRGCTVALGGLLIVLITGCQSESATTIVATPTAATESTMPSSKPSRAIDKRLRVDEHFKGVDRELAEAAGNGDTASIQRLIQDKGANPNAVSEQSLPMLLWPVYRNNIEGFKALLQHGAKINQPVPPNDVLIGFVVELRGLDFVQAAVAAGADLNARNADGEPITLIARRQQRWDVVKFLITSGADINATQTGIIDASLLSAAIGFGDFEHAYWLLENGADATIRLTESSAPSAKRVGAQPMLEDIFFRPISDPQISAWQQKCQSFLLAKGITAPTRPQRFPSLN
jgi:uncharacterized protein